MISAVLLTKNNQKVIPEVVKNLRFVDEIVVVDNYSTDKTAELAKKSEARVWKRRLNGDFAAQRNFGLSKAKNEWVLFLDTDERVSKTLASSMLRAVGRDEVDGCDIKRVDMFFGKRLRHGETGSMYLTRLGKKSAGAWRRPVHEVWDLENRLRLDGELIHYPHDSIESFLEKINWYTDLEAEYRVKQGIKFSFVELMVYPIGKFAKNYFLKLGFLDGMRGLIMAILMSTHSFAVRAKLYNYEKTKKTI